MHLSAIARLAAAIALTIVLLGLAIHDQLTTKVPNRVVRPLLVACLVIAALRLGLGQVGLGEAALIATTWVTCTALAWLSVFGHGDMKIVIALVALFPEMRLIYLLLAASLAGQLLVLVLSEGRVGLRRLALLLMAASQGMLPSRAEISEAYESRGRPVTFVFSLAGIAYMWLYWVRV